MEHKTIQQLTHARLPKWLLPSDWPMTAGIPQLATISWSGGRIYRLCPATDDHKGMHLEGRLVLPGLVEAHAHLDKTFTRHRLGEWQPGLLNAIDAMHLDQSHWSYEDLYERAEKALVQAYQNGVVVLRSHVDWFSSQTPLAWDVLADLAVQWQSRIQLQRVALIPLGLLADKAWTQQVAKIIRLSMNSQMGAFIHSSNLDEQAIENLLQAAFSEDLALDLHIDEELSERPQGVLALLDTLDNLSFDKRIVCGHACALSSTDEAVALRLLDRVAKYPITLVALPTTNLLLQDATRGRTPRQRGITLLHEARQRHIPTMIATDNVQDAFCSLGQYDPVKTLQVAVYSAHLDQAFDVWSQSICRSDWLESPDDAGFSLLGKAADFVIFETQDYLSWPSDSARLVMREGQFITDKPVSFLSVAQERGNDDESRGDRQRSTVSQVCCQQANR